MKHARRLPRLWICGLALTVLSCRSSPTLVTPPAPLPGSEAIEATVFLIGDAGKSAPTGDPVLSTLGRMVREDPGRATVVFLGDNVYPSGIPAESDPGRHAAEQRLGAQIDVVDTTVAHGIFVPGNHDWAASGDDGWEAVQRQEQLIAQRGRPSVGMLPGGGCPGPVVVDVGTRLRLVVLDTEWWLRSGPKPVGPGSDCLPSTVGGVVDSLRGALRDADDRYLGVVTHHPLESGGIHGGHFGILDHLFPLRAWKSWLWVPLPVIGSAYPVARMSGISSQDLTSSAFGVMRDSLTAAFRVRRPLFYAAGHEHNLQVLDGEWVSHFLVSGGGYYGHTTRVVHVDESRYAEAESGFMRVDVLRDGRVRLGIITVTADGNATEAFSMWLASAPM
ncbi:MAG: hypothetical protein OER90_16145 [Gemmatimonadota bacterium]|nr:hypothetical protein [Gemmatimonadota bacterium]